MYGENGNPNAIEKYRPFVYWRDSGQTAEEVLEQVRLSAAAGVGGFIPLPIKNDELTPEEITARFKEFYARLLPAAQAYSLPVAFTLSDCIEKTVVAAEEIGRAHV